MIGFEDSYEWVWSDYCFLSGFLFESTPSEF